MASRRNNRDRGFTYLWVMFTVAITGVLLAGAGQLWRTEAQREKEKELMFIGEQFRLAIGSYYESSPGLPKRYPPTLEKLLLDDRFPTVKRHLRKIFLDPMTGAPKWGLIMQPGIGITGVHSLSAQTPLKRANFHERYAFGEAKSYRDWKFAYSPGDAEQLAPKPQQSGQQAQQSGQQQQQTGQLRQPQTQPENKPESQAQAESGTPDEARSAPSDSPFGGGLKDSPGSGSFNSGSFNTGPPGYPPSKMRE